MRSDLSSNIISGVEKTKYWHGDTGNPQGERFSYITRILRLGSLANDFFFLSFFCNDYNLCSRCVILGVKSKQGKLVSEKMPGAWYNTNNKKTTQGSEDVHSVTTVK